MDGDKRRKENERVAFVLTSGNWDIDMIGKILNDEEVEARK